MTHQNYTPTAVCYADILGTDEKKISPEQHLRAKEIVEYFVSMKPVASANEAVDVTIKEDV